VKIPTPKDLASMSAAIERGLNRRGIHVQVTLRADGTVAVNGATGGGRSAPLDDRRGAGTIRSTGTSLRGSGTAAQVNVHLDGRLVQTSMVNLRRQQGGSLDFLP
jgi:hypothetical protein